VVTEETERMIGERRLAALRDVAARVAGAKTQADLFAAVSRSIEANPHDLPFTLTYLFEQHDGGVSLAAASGISRSHPAAVESFDVHDPHAPWPLSDTLPIEGTLIDNLKGRFPNLPTGPWDAPATHALLVPIAQQGQPHAAGVFVAALNPYRPFNDAYQSFVGLMAGQIAAGLANVRSYEEERRRAEALAEIDRLKTTFFSNVSHEFRTPLTLMLGPTEDALASPARALAREDHETLHRNQLPLL
jgi:GAF domain-containing protein